MSKRSTQYDVNPYNKHVNRIGKTVQTTSQESQLERAKRQLCSNGCTPIFYYKKVLNSCKPLYNPAKKDKNCFTDTPYDNFYSKINWDLLHDIIESKLIDFSYICGQDQQLVDMFNNCYKPQFVIRGGELFIAKQSNSGNANFCKDIIVSFKVPCIRGTSSNHNFQIFHIALHSRMPYYNKADDINTYACGYAVKNDSTYIDCGPFHYKIDNNCLDLANFLNKDPNKGCYTSFGFSKIDTAICPFKKFEFNPENARFIRNNDLFIIPDPDTATIEPECMTIHRIIYNKFIDFWNNYILPDVSLLPVPSLPVPSLPVPSLPVPNLPENIAVLADAKLSDNIKQPSLEEKVSNNVLAAHAPAEVKITTLSSKGRKAKGKKHLKKKNTNKKRKSNKRRSKKQKQ
jgi:hypothetical protein